MKKLNTFLKPIQSLKQLSPFILFTTLIISGCSLSFLNAKPAQELKPPAPPSVNLYAGWRVFQDKCSRCHGAAATGTEKAPNLLPLVQDMNARHFAELVLKRYDLGAGLPSDSQDKKTVESTVGEIMRGVEPPTEMPAWQGEPAVNANILDLYGYLSARVEGKFSKERPER